MKGFSSFYRSFYGYEFARHFRRPSELKSSRIQYTITTPQQLYLHVHKNSGFRPCFVSVYDYGKVDNLKQRNRDILCLDRVYFDFDIHNEEANAIKHILEHLRSKGANHTIILQNKLKNRLRYLIIDERIAKPAIDEAKIFAEQFKVSFGKYPALFFSGFKGCHAYCFMEPVKLEDPNSTISDFAERIKTIYGFKTLDLSVNRDALTRISRVPYSKHQLTGLTVAPFNVTDSYDEIMNKSIKPVIEPFTTENHLTTLNDHLKNIDEILEYNKEFKSEKEAQKRKYVMKNAGKLKYSKIKDNRKFFKQVLGDPTKEYEHYDMYHCPFQNHSDSHPSFMVYNAGYECKGCNKKGNYWQFLKDYHGWTNKQVKEYLKNR